MELLIRRIYLKHDCTLGALRVYEGEEKEGGDYLCDTFEPHAIAWKGNPFIGLRAGRYVAGKTAIPEGTYGLMLKYSRHRKQFSLWVKDVEVFGSVQIRAGKKLENSHGDILIGRAAFNCLVRLIRDAMARGDGIRLVVRSTKNWKK